MPMRPWIISLAATVLATSLAAAGIAEASSAPATLSVTDQADTSSVGISYTGGASDLSGTVVANGGPQSITFNHDIVVTVNPGTLAGKWQQYALSANATALAPPGGASVDAGGVFLTSLGFGDSAAQAQSVGTNGWIVNLQGRTLTRTMQPMMSPTRSYASCTQSPFVGLWLDLPNICGSGAPGIQTVTLWRVTMAVPTGLVPGTTYTRTITFQTQYGNAVS